MFNEHSSTKLAWCYIKWWRRGSNSRGLTPIGNQDKLKSNALDQLGHATVARSVKYIVRVIIHLVTEVRRDTTDCILPAAAR